MSRCQIIAEIGINHNGSIDLARHLADMAKECGCDFVKLQKREIDWCYSDEQLRAHCESQWGTTVEDKVRGRELSWDEIEEFDQHCKSIDMQWICSCFDLKSLRYLAANFPHLPLMKVPSALAMRTQYLVEVAEYKKRTLISAGLLTNEQLQGAADLFDARECEYILNHCQALYPCPQERINMAVLPIMRHFYHERPFCMGIGYSGHETGVLPSVVAALLGALYVERHITLDRALQGSDHAASLEKQGLARLVRDIRDLDVIMGSATRELHGDEKNPVTYWRVT